MKKRTWTIPNRVEDICTGCGVKMMRPWRLENAKCYDCKKKRQLEYGRLYMRAQKEKKLQQKVADKKI